VFESISKFLKVFFNNYKGQKNIYRSKAVAARPCAESCATQPYLPLTSSHKRPLSRCLESRPDLETSRSQFGAAQGR
jgi:hypothetical protein